MQTSVCASANRAIRPAARRCVRAHADNRNTDFDRAQKINERAEQFFDKSVNAPYLEEGQSFAEDAKRTLEPRVDELRDDQLAKGMEKREDIMSFTGPLPEIVNGRLAMLGITACIAAEIVSHRSLPEQVATAPWAIAATFAVFIIASLVPVLRGAKQWLPEKSKEGTSFGFTLTNELINGRAAMVGFFIIFAYETVSRSPLFG